MKLVSFKILLKQGLIWKAHGFAEHSFLHLILYSHNQGGGESA